MPTPEDLSSIPGTYPKTESTNFTELPSDPIPTLTWSVTRVPTYMHTHPSHIQTTFKLFFLEQKDPTLDFATCFSNPDFRPFRRLKLAERGTCKDSSCFTEIVNRGDEDSGALSPSNQYQCS